MNTKLLSRLGIFFIGIPLVILLIWLPYFQHLALHLLICAMSALSSVELYRMLRNKTQLLPMPLVVTCSVLIPFITALEIIVPSFTGKSLFNIGTEISTFVFIVCLLVFLGFEVFSAKDFEPSLLRLASSVFILLYSGFLFTFIQRMTVFTVPVNGVPVNVSSQYISFFILMVFMCDSLAWFFGMLLGKNNKGFVKASPNKSIAGFCGGFVGSIGAAVACYFIWPGIFEGGIWKNILMGFFIACSSIIGDLAESVFKRSAGVKDSGTIMPGRGGVLDSVDSILMSAPVFYIIASLLYHLI